MVRRDVLGPSRAVTIRGSLVVLLASISLPAVAATGFMANCDDAPAEAAAQTATSAQATGDHERLAVLKTEGDVRSLSPVSDLGSIIETEFDRDSGLPAPQVQELQSSAVADALERRRQGRLEGPADDIEELEAAPSIDTALPGVGDAESLLYRREMYRTDI